ncbi:MAG: glycosyltransferase family 2 protein [Lachnospiraceae bacterium]|nr:glycosyltransferase family 2 protein [Lachnospiraceae bacterium]
MSDNTRMPENPVGENDRLQEDLRALREKYERTRTALEKRSELIARTEGSRTMKLVRKLLTKAGRPDPFAALRPRLTFPACGICHHIDTVSYRKEHVIIRGWAYDMTNQEVPPVLIRDRSRVIDAIIHRYPRQDVNDELGLSADVCTGFSFRITLTDLRHPAITLEFENENGYMPVEMPILITEKARQQYFEENAHPIYAVDNAGYDDWFHDHRVSEETLRQQAADTFPEMPLISICIPLYNTPARFLRELMDTLLGQSYRKIEICLADGSTSDEPGRLIAEEYPDERVIYRRLEENTGISGNTNAAFAMASGDFIMLADHDDTLEKDAVYELVRAINTGGDVDIVYTDEDKLMLTQGVYYSPNFKPDYSPDLLRSNNYITHIFCVRKTLLDLVGGEDPAYDGAQDYDFILRCCEKARRIVHVPKVLYHWRAHEASTAGNPESKLYAYENGRRAIEAHYRRVGIPARAELSEDYGAYRSLYEIQGRPKVSVIIPNKDMTEVLRRCLESIFEKTTYDNYEIIIAENNSVTEEIFAYYRELTEKHACVKVVTWEGPFNYSAINNFAVREATGDYLLFLNNDTEVITERWMEEMLGYCQRSDVGMCGARLYYPDDRLQHCGVVIGIGGIAGHICHLEKRGQGGYFGRVVKTQDVSAVTAACMMMPRRVFEEVGGFDESFAVAYNDIDLCLKVRDRGYLIVYDAWCELYHHESLSRGSDDAAVDKARHERQMAEARRLRSHWPAIFRDGDPYFNANLDLDTSDYVLKGTIPPNYSTLEAQRKKGEFNA